MITFYPCSVHRIIANYMMWKVVVRFASSLSLKFRDVYQEYSKSLSGVAGEDPRWQDCLGMVDGSFGMPFGLLFVNKAFEGESKKSVGTECYSPEVGDQRVEGFIDKMTQFDVIMASYC